MSRSPRLTYAMIREIACGMRELADCDPLHRRAYVTCAQLIERALPSPYVPKGTNPGRRIPPGRNEAIIAMRKEGKRQVEIARTFGISPSSVQMITGRTGRILPYAYKAKSDSRNIEIAALRAEGKTLQEIADKFGMTRERVRQLTGKHVHTSLCVICDGELSSSKCPKSAHVVRCRALHHHHGIEEGRRRYLLLKEREERIANGEWCCYRCQSWKLKSEFHGNGSSHACKECMKVRCVQQYQRRKARMANQ